MRLFAGVGSFEVLAGCVGLGLVPAAGGGELVVANGNGPVVEQVEHLSGIELGAATEPVAALGLVGGFEVVLGGALDVVLATLGVGEAEPGKLETRVDEEVGLAGVGEDGLVGSDSLGAVAGVLGEVGFFQAVEVVAGELCGEAVLDDEGLGVAGVVAQEEGEDGARFD